MRETILNKHGWTPLHAACYFCQKKIVKYLIKELDCDVNKTNLNGWNALFFAIFGRDIVVIEYLLSKTKVNKEAKDLSQKTPMDLAKEINDEQIIEIL